MPDFFVHDNSIAENVVQAHTFYGSPVTAQARPDSHGANISPATWSSAPYKPPRKRRRRWEGKLLCLEDGCHGFPSAKAGGEYCVGHARRRGLLPTCAHAKCNGSPKGESIWCHHHEPEPVTEEVPADGNAE